MAQLYYNLNILIAELRVRRFACMAAPPLHTYVATRTNRSV